MLITFSHWIQKQDGSGFFDQSEREITRSMLFTQRQHKKNLQIWGSKQSCVPELFPWTIVFDVPFLHFLLCMDQTILFPF